MSTEETPTENAAEEPARMSTLKIVLLIGLFGLLIAGALVALAVAACFSSMPNF